MNVITGTDGDGSGEMSRFSVQNRANWTTADHRAMNANEAFNALLIALIRALADVGGTVTFHGERLTYESACETAEARLNALERELIDILIMQGYPEYVLDHMVRVDGVLEMGFLQVKD